MISLEDLCKASPQTIVVTSVGTLRDAFALWNEEQLAKKKQEEDTTLLDETTVQHLLHKSRPTLWRWDKIGYLPYHKIGGKIYYRQVDVERVMQGLKSK